MLQLRHLIQFFKFSLGYGHGLTALDFKRPRLDTCKRQSLEVCRVDQAAADYFMGGAFGSV